MHALYFIVLMLSVPIIIYPFVKNKHISFLWIGSAAIILILYGIGTYRSCSDGWNSPSIGSSGACSHHGGVVQNMNEIGLIILICCILSVLAICLIDYKKRKSLREECNEVNAQENSIIKTKKVSFEHYEKYIITWHNGGLSVDEIVEHLNSVGVSASRSRVENYLNDK